MNNPVEERPGSPAKWRYPVAYVLGLFAAAILTMAAFHKACDPVLFIQQISAHQVTPAAWSPFLAYFFVLAELLAAAAFVAFIWPRLVFAATILMMLGFIGVTAWAWAQGNVSECGCFGRLVERGPQEVIIEDAAIIAASLLGLFLARGFRTRPRQWALVLPLVAAAILLTLLGPQLPIDSVVVGIGQGSDLSNMALQGLRGGIDDGWVLLLLVGPECPACDAGIAPLKPLAAEHHQLRIVAAFSGTRGTAQTWRMETLPNFPVATASERVLRQYFRRLPVTFLLEDGIVRHVWWNHIPLPEEVLPELPAASP